MPGGRAVPVPSRLMTNHAERPARPTQVTVAFWLQLAAVALLLGLVGVAVAYAVYFDGEISRAARLVPDADPVEVRDERGGNIFMTLMIGVPALLLAIWLAATAVPVRRGSNAGRILVFVAAGGQLLFCASQSCGGFLFLPLFVTLAGDEVSGTDEAPFDEVPWEESEFYKTLYSESDPFLDILFPIAGFGTFLLLTLATAVVLLLVLPPANRYFVPRAVPTPLAWAPSTPGQPAGHPAHPAGYPMPVSYPVPVGGPVPVSYPVCPDPAAHVRPVAGSATGPADPAGAAGVAGAAVGTAAEKDHGPGGVSANRPD